MNPAEKNVTSTLGPDLDLAEEEFIYHGKRLTPERAERIAAETLAQARQKNLIPGGKSLSGGNVHSPRVQFRVSVELHDEAERAAQAEGISLSALARHALEEYLHARAA